MECHHSPAQFGSGSAVVSHVSTVSWNSHQQAGTRHIAGAHVDKNDLNVDTRDKRTMIECTSGEMQGDTALTHSLATRLGKLRTNDDRSHGTASRLVIEHVQAQEHPVVISTQNEPLQMLPGTQDPINVAQRGKWDERDECQWEAHNTNCVTQTSVYASANG